MTDRRACVTVEPLCDWGANMAEPEYTSVGTIRWERKAVFFTPDGDHCVKQKVKRKKDKRDEKDEQDGKDISSAVFVDEKGRGLAVPLTGGELELKPQDSAKFVAAAGGAAKVKIAIKIASDTKLEKLGDKVKDAEAELVSVPAE